jgi:hypothetical protein
MCLEEARPVLEVLGCPPVVVMEQSDVLRRALPDELRHVSRHSEIHVVPRIGDAWIVEIGIDDLADVAAAVVRDAQSPRSERLGENVLYRLPQVLRRPVRR